MGDVAVRVEGLGKRYRIGATQVRHDTLRDQLVALATGPARRLRQGLAARGSRERDTIWAVRDLSFEVARGEVVGLVGRNGAGKSTVLKILSRVTDPTTGRVEIRGRVGSLLEVGTGFHPELSGRENVFLNGAVLGMRRAEIARKFDDIVAFAELGKFIDTPVKRYSSGMYVRLAFAVAAHLEPEILIVDEVLAVGDAAFQKKCLGKMGEVARSGRTVLFVSHNMGAVAELCTRGVLLHEGVKVMEGDIGRVLDAYAVLTRGREGGVRLALDPTLPCSVVDLAVRNGAGEEVGAFDLSDEVVVSIRYRVLERMHGLQLTATLARNMVDVVHSFDTDELGEIPVRDPGLYEAVYRIPPMFLKAGVYSLRVTSGTPDRLVQDLEGVASFEIEERTVNAHSRGYRRDRPGHVISPGTWETTCVEPADAAHDVARG